MTDILTPPTTPDPRPAPRWVVRPPAPPEAVRRLTRDMSLPPLLASVLWGRGLYDEAINALHPPLELTKIPALKEAAERLEHALKNKKRILIHGDYDADGMSGTAVLTLGLRALGGNVTPFLPNRLTDGYGVSPRRVAEHCENADLFITVDCGISNGREVEALQAAGVEVIVTDHHHPGQVLPPCLVVHPTHADEARPGRPELTGAGVAYHLLWALHARLGLEPPAEYSDLASIGTIADVAPLMGENRALIQEGLARLADSKWPGLRATLSRTLASRAPTARDVAFVLAPRLNAAGRLGEAELGLELLTTASERRARELAAYLDARNGDRRKIQDAMFQDALTRADPDAPALVLEHPDWHPGVMGIVASKLLERFYKPVFIIAKGKGSVRSTPGISAVEGLYHAQDHLERFGGHSQAAGFGIREENVSGFRESIFGYVKGFPTPRPLVLADALLTSSDIDADLYGALSTLEPYGQGHPAPLFALTDTLEHARAVGKEGAHLQLRVAGVKGVSWGRGHEARNLSVGTSVDAAVSIRENEWQGKKSLEFLAEALRPAEPLGFETSLDAPHIIRGRPQESVPRFDGGSLESFADALWLRDVPLGDAPLEVTGPLHTLVTSGAVLYFDLRISALERLETAAARYPTVGELRGAFVYLSRGQKPPFEEGKLELCKRALEELALLDARGKPLKGQKRDPYTSDTLLTGLVERYKLRTLFKAYRGFDDAAFAHTVVTLFGASSVTTRAEE